MHQSWNCRLSPPNYHSWRPSQGVCLSWSPSAGLLEGLTEESTCCFSAGWRSAQVRCSQSPFDSSKSGTGNRVTLSSLSFHIWKLSERNLHALILLPTARMNQTLLRRTCLLEPPWGTNFPQGCFYWLHLYLQQSPKVVLLNYYLFQYLSFPLYLYCSNVRFHFRAPTGEDGLFLCCFRCCWLLLQLENIFLWPKIINGTLRHKHSGWIYKTDVTFANIFPLQSQRGKRHLARWMQMMAVNEVQRCVTLGFQQPRRCSRS